MPPVVCARPRRFISARRTSGVLSVLLLSGCGGTGVTVAAYGPGEPRWACAERSISTTDRAAPDPNTTIEQAIVEAVGSTPYEVDQSDDTNPFRNVKVLNDDAQLTAVYSFKQWVYLDGTTGGWYLQQKEQCA